MKTEIILVVQAKAFLVEIKIPKSSSFLKFSVFVSDNKEFSQYRLSAMAKRFHVIESKDSINFE